MSITIGLPFYNNEDTLADAIRSVFAQTFQDWELILVDDGSDDSSLRIAQSVADPRVRVVSDGTNRGLAARLNQITKLANGCYLARMDADDIMHPNRLTEQLSLLEENPEIDVVGSSMYSFDDSLVVRGLRGDHEVEASPRSALSKGIMVHVSAFARKAWFALHPYNESLRRAQDRDLWCRACRDSTFSVISRPLMYVRETTGERTISNYLRGCQSERDLFRKYGPSFVGGFSTRLLIGKSYLRSALHYSAHLVGVRAMLIKRRNNIVSPSELQNASRTLDEIRQTSVPGLAIHASGGSGELAA